VCSLFCCLFVVVCCLLLLFVVVVCCCCLLLLFVVVVVVAVVCSCLFDFLQSIGAFGFTYKEIKDNNILDKLFLRVKHIFSSHLCLSECKYLFIQ
jgi:hypothetical protein